MVPVPEVKRRTIAEEIETPFDGEDKIRVEILRRQELRKRIDEFSSLRKRIS